MNTQPQASEMKRDTSRKPAQPSAPARVGDGIRPHDIEKELKDSFLDYSMSVIVSRALPDARDGLKPVHRRVLYAMHELGLTPGKPYKKSAMVVGEVLGKYHPHGDISVYDAIVRMAQNFAMHEPLVDGQGNFGSSDGDSAAAYRYTEARMTEVSSLMIQDLDKDTVDFRPNFDGRLQEPVVLPAAVPNLLVNGSEGIAVGMATKIPPHNLREIVQAAELILDNPDVKDAVVMRRVSGPDFPTGGILYGTEGLDDLYRHGRGKLLVRAKFEAERMANGKVALIVREMPYAVLKAPLLEKMAAMIRDNAEVAGTGGKTWSELITTLRDESDRDGMRVVIELARGANPAAVRTALYKKTDLQVTYAAQMIALVKGAPVQLGLKAALEVFLAHRMEVVERRSRFELNKAQDRAHIVAGLLIAVASIDEVVRIIRKSKDTQGAVAALMKRFKLTEIQTRAILAMRLSSLTSLDVIVLEREKENLEETIARLKKIVNLEAEKKKVVREEMREVARLHGRDRRTEVVGTEPEGEESEDSGPKEEVMEVVDTTGVEISLSPSGQMTMSGGRRAKEAPRQKIEITAQKRALAVGASGTGWKMAVSDISLSGTRALAAGMPEEERVMALWPESDLAEEKWAVFVLANGMIKRMKASECAGAKAGGKSLIKLDEGDEMVAAFLAGETDLLIFSRNGQVLRTPVAKIPEQGRAARGVAGIKLDDGDEVVSASLTQGDVAIVTTRGMGRVSPLEDFPVQGRGSRGVVLFKGSEKTGKTAFATSLAPGGGIHLVTETGYSSLTAEDLPRGARHVVPKPLGAGEEVRSGWTGP